MKTQVNKFEAERQLTNKVMFIFLLVVGSLLLFVLVKNIYNEVFSKTYSSYEILNPNKGFSGMGYVVVKKSNNLNKIEDAGYITPIKPCCAKQIRVGLEIKKMKGFMNSNRKVLLQQTMEALADVEEPEFLIEEVFRSVKTQETKFEEVLEIEEWMLNEESWNANTNMTVPATALEVETESTLNVENWMTDDDTWRVYNYEALSAFAAESATEETLEVEEWMTNEANWIVYNYEALYDFASNTTYEESLDLEPWMFSMNVPVQKEKEETGIDLLEPIVASKNTEILNEINLVKNLKEFLTKTDEEQLKIEGWMKDSKYWSVNELANY